MPCLRRMAAASFKQVKESFLQMHACLPTSFLPSTRGQTEREGCYSNFDQMRGKGAGVVKGVVW
jgi:hypothetical protein